MNENWTSMNPPPELSDSDAELLSAYLDNMLDAGEVAALEARLASDAFLRSELAAMRQMLGWLKTMPQLKAPRNFTISETDVKPVTPKIIPIPRRNNWQFASAAAAIVLVLFGFVAFYSQNSMPLADNGQVAAQATQVKVDEAESSPLVASTSSSLLMPTEGVPPMVGGNTGSGSSTGSTGSGGGAPVDAQEAATTGEMNDLARTSDSDFGADAEMNPVDASIETALIEATPTIAADGQIAESALAMPTETANAVAIYAYGTDTPQPSQEMPSEETMAMSIQQDVVAESTEAASIMMTAPIAEEPESDDSSTANIAIGSAALNRAERIKELVRGIFQRLLDDIQR